MSDLNLNEKTFFAIDDLIQDYFPEVDEDTFYEDFTLDKLKELCGDKKFIILNLTDGVPISPKEFDIIDAINFIEEFPKRFERQGHYTTSRGEMIPPSSIRYEFRLLQ